MLGDGSAKITVKKMKDYLRLRSQAASGRKHELAQRIIGDLSELGTVVPAQGPLAAAYCITLKGMTTWMLAVMMKARSMHE